MNICHKLGEIEEINTERAMKTGVSRENCEGWQVVRSQCTACIACSLLRQVLLNTYDPMTLVVASPNTGPEILSHQLQSPMSCSFL